MKRLLCFILLLFLLPNIGLSETLSDIFPDPNVARFVRDEIGLISIDDEVTQEKLDSAWLFGNFDGYGEIKDIQGISRLRNLLMLRLSCHWESDVHITTLPDELFDMKSITIFELYYLPNLCSLPDKIGNMTQLQALSLEKCGISSLPESIGNLVNLTTLDISGCPITSLPESIGNLTNLTHLDISDTLITELPASIENLVNLESFNRSGTPL